ncbi:hypothetical protein B0T16DRAFT_423177 [Cercophora newfieldiana]|uniref:Uncharacterized protein n=1 Tax=Cercophora newfieldiana TaxID=92897 RepID=A0AA39XTC2_9PEZI|nr:hypothetical protein B0T16DRAFT_423177 [Cercophora newfieldiana]
MLLYTRKAPPKAPKRRSRAGMSAAPPFPVEASYLMLSSEHSPLIRTGGPRPRCSQISHAAMSC